MNVCSVRQWIVLLLGAVIPFCHDCRAGSVHTYGETFDLRIPADPDSTGKSWMDDAVIEVPDHLTISDLDVCIDLSHSSAFDLQLFVQSPDGTGICLNMYDFDEFFKGEDYAGTTFDDEADLPISEAEPPFSGRFQPREALDVFDGQDAFGQWRLQIYDAWYYDTGTLHSFELVIEASPVKVTVPNVQGMAEADAESAIASAGLIVGDVTHQESNAIPAGYVLSQNPSAGTSVDAGSAVNLIVSSGFTEPIRQPEVVSLEATDFTGTGATLWGSIQDDGGEACLYRFCFWGPDPYQCSNWSASDDCKSSGQIFSDRVTNLQPGTYYFVAEAMNSAGASDGAQQQSFNIYGPFGGSGSGVKNDPYIITNVVQLQQINSDLNAYYKLANDIAAYNCETLNDGQGLKPIGSFDAPFRGFFNGNGHVIRGLYINRSGFSYVGLFSRIKAGEISDVGLIDVNMAGVACVGGLVGFNEGTIRRCYVTGSVTGSRITGGLIGRNDGIIQDCYCTADVRSNEQGQSIGGLVGQNEKGTLQDCYSTGCVTGNQCGGLAGSCYGQCHCCFWNVETSGQATSACGTGKTTSQMQTMNTFVDAGWGFTEVWAICENMGYPKLLWQIAPADFLCPDGVDMSDFAFFAAHCGQGNCGTLNNYCDVADLNQSGEVDFNDLTVFAIYWLIK